jgi:glycosyltransferase involved in cell wall biosynthesis
MGLANLRLAACLHACGENEIRDYREYSLTNPIALIPNGISKAWLDAAIDPQSFRIKYGLPIGVRILLYVSRVTPKKGLALLLDALCEMKQLFSNWLFVIAGPDEFGYQMELHTLVKSLGIDASVRFIGPIHGADKRNAFSAADLFVLPSYSEGNPLSILEALGAGVPVVTTVGTPWSDLVSFQCGWWTDISTAGLADAMSVALGKSKGELAVMGARGRVLVSRNYDWTEISRKTICLYDWLTYGGTRPEFVHLF